MAMRKLLFSMLSLAVFAVGSSAAEEVTVTMAGMQYKPATVALDVGDTVRFVNDGEANHNVFVPTAGFALDLGKQEPGSEIIHKLGKAGTFEVECVFHPQMLLKVEVR